MQLGLSTHSFPWAIGIGGYEHDKKLSATDLVHTAKEAQVGHLQFGDNYPLHELSAEQLQSLKETAAHANIQLEVGTRGLHMENILKYLEIVNLFGANFLRVVVDTNDFEPDEDEIIHCILALLPQLQQYDVILAIENHDRFSAAALKKIIRGTSDRYVGICLDTANSYGNGEGYKDTVAVLAPYTVNLHLKDITIKRLPHKMGFTIQGCAAGAGVINIPWVVEEVRKYNRCRTATLEVWSSPTDSMEETLHKEKEWVQTSLHYLKNILT
jgi:sugar phosphate isomerase/epimerase